MCYWIDLLVTTWSLDLSNNNDAIKYDLNTKMDVLYPSMLNLSKENNLTLNNLKFGKFNPLF